MSDKVNGKFKYWCQKVLPLVYDDSLSYYEVLCKVVNALNVLGEQSEDVQKELDNLNDKLFDVVSQIIKSMYEEGAFNTINNAKLFDFACVKTGQQGDCFIVKYGSKIIMVDSGYQNDSAQITNALNNYGSHVDYLIITHFDPDHIGGILNGYYNSFFDSGTTAFIGIHSETGLSWYNTNITNVVNNLKNLGCNIVYVTENEVYNIGVNTFFKFNNTTINASYDIDSAAGMNDLSLLTTFNCGNKKMLFCGDAGIKAQNVNTEYLDKVDLFTIPHHGGSNIILDSFLNKISPSCGFACDDHATSTLQGRPNAGDKRQLTDAGITVYTTITAGSTFETSVYVGNVLSAGKAWQPNDYVTTNMISGISDDLLTDDKVFNSLNQYQKMFISGTADKFSAENKILLNNRVNNIFGYRGATSQKNYHVSTLYENFDVIQYKSGDDYITRSFAFARLVLHVVNGAVESANNREISTLIEVNNDFSFKVFSTHPCLIFISSVSDTSVDNGASLFNANNVSQGRVIRAAGDKNTNNLCMIQTTFGSVYHLSAVTATTFNFNIIIL